MRLLADENFNGDVFRGLLRAEPQLDIVRVQDRIRAGLPMPGVIEVREDLSVGTTIEQILIVLFASQPHRLYSVLALLIGSKAHHDGRWRRASIR